MRAHDRGKVALLGGFRSGHLKMFLVEEMNGSCARVHGIKFMAIPSSD